MPQSWIQQGAIAERDLTRLLILATKGPIEVTVPLTDDERREV